MITETATGFLEGRLGASFRFYRLFFNAIALLTLIPVLAYSLSLKGQPMLRWEGAGLVLRYVLVVCGVVLLIAGGRHYSLRQFVGISQLRGTRAAGLARGGGIDSTGVLGLVRHPWYTGIVLLLWARDLDGPRFVVNVVLTAYFVVGTLLEERKLVREFGDAYRGYQRRVSMFVPLKWLRSRIAP